MKVMLLYLRTGGGHYSWAKTLAAYFAERKVNTILVDGLEGSPSYARIIVEDGYKLSQTNAKLLYEGTYALHKWKPIRKQMANAFSHAVMPSLARRIVKERPDSIIILHPLLILPTKAIAHTLIPLKVIVTEPFSAPPLWFPEKDLHYIVCSAQQQRIARRHGVKHCTVMPHIMKKQFYAKQNIAVLKKKYGFGEKVVLLLGGGDGLPNGQLLLKLLLRAKIDADLVLVAGRNVTLQKYAENLHADRLHVFGFVDTVHELIACSDVVITKAGPLTLFEILSQKKIPLITSYIWEQEKANVEFVRKKKLGTYSPFLFNVPTIVKKLLNHPEPYLNNIQKLKFENPKKLIDFLLK